MSASSSCKRSTFYSKTFGTRLRSVSINCLFTFWKVVYIYLFTDYLLSNNHVNSIIVHKFDFSDEEVMAYYISFLKTLSFRLNKHTIHFFYNEVSLWPRGLAASTASKKVLPLAEMRILSIPDATTVEWRINPLALTITSGYLRISPSVGNAFVIWKCLKIANNMSIFSFWVDSALDFE